LTFYFNGNRCAPGTLLCYSLSPFD
jgi:hypothetical protein